MNKYDGYPFEVILKRDGDIVILDYSVDKVVYHKTYNPCDDLRDNLMKAFDRLMELENAYFSQADQKV